MECQECHERPAALHFTKIVNGEKTEIYVCDVCAKEKGYMGYDEDGYSLHNLLSGLFNFDHPQVNEQQTASTPSIYVTKCAKCGMTYEQFKRKGKFGCAACYETFSDRLNPIFKRVHSGNTKHFGKIPKRTGSGIEERKKLEKLKKQLSRLIDNQEFEQAAQIRDEIRALQTKQSQQKGGDL